MEHIKHQFEVDSLAGAFDLLMKSLLYENSQTEDFQEYLFKISSKLDEEIKESSFSYYMKNSKSILITFKSVSDDGQAFIFWRTSSLETFKCLYLSEDSQNLITEFCVNFLVNELTNGKNGILKSFKERNKLDIKHIGNELNQNLLIIAASKSHSKVVESLLAHFDFDVDSIDIDGCNAIERTWEGNEEITINEIEFENTMLILLNSNSKLPRNNYFVNKKSKKIYFKFKKAPQRIKNFVNECRNLHHLAKSSEVENIKKFITTKPNLMHFYNENNVSLMAHALKFNKIEVCKLLVSLKVSIGQHEINNLDNLYKTLEEDQRLQLQRHHRVNAIEIPKFHVYTLLQCSKIARNDRQHDERWGYVEEAYRIIDSNETCSKILKIASIFTTFIKITIYFDFKHEIVYYLDPKSNSGGLAKIYGVDTVYIGAKNLIDNNKKYDVFGAIIHELCHFAVFTTYLNDYNPYPLGESKEREFFEEVVVECIENRKVEEEIVGSVMSYPEYQRDSEFIVRVVQMLMHYCLRDPELNERKEKFPKLFKYFKEVVEKDFDDLLKIFERLLDRKQYITFEELTGPFKTRILYADIIFQGQKTNFYGVIGNDFEILELMNPQQIRGMLIDGQHIPIAEDTYEYFESSERSFADYNTDLSMKIKEEIKSSEEIIEEIEESRIFILADTAGAGKTTSFQNLSVKLKETYKNCWVSLIELRKFQHIFEKFNKDRNLTIEKIFEMLHNIHNLDSDRLSLESKIFKKLFFKDNVILLFDAVDEISPHFNEFILNVLQKIQEATNNQILVSTRPQHAKELSEKLGAKPYKLVPFSWKEKESFILEMLTDSEDYDDSKEQEILNEFRVFFKSIKSIGYFNYDIDNPLMVKIITELYINGQIDLKNQSLDLYEIFEKIELSHKEQVDSKVAFKDRDPFSTISLESVHQALAILLLFSRYNTELKQTYIIASWNGNKAELTAERIQRYGFVRIGQDFKENDNFALDFTHRTYAEFFVAKFILTFLFKVEDYMKDEELEKVIKVIKAFVDNDTIDNIFGFIMCYMKNEVEGRKLILKNRIKKLILNEFQEMKNELFFNPNDEQLLLLRFFSVFFIREQNILSDFWLLNQERNMLRMILIETNILGSFKLQNLMEILSISFGVNWHEIINKSQQKLIKDEEIGDIEVNQNFYIRAYNRNLFKFLEYFENNFTFHEKVTVCRNNVFVYDNVDFIGMKVMKKMLQMYSELSKKNTEILVDILLSFIKYTTNEGILLYLAENIEQLLNRNVEDIQKVLFFDYEKDQHPIFKAIKFKNLKIFQKFKNLYDSYKTSSNDLKNYFFTGNNLLYLTLQTPNKMFPDVLKFIKEIYNSDHKKFVQSLEPQSDLIVLNQIFEDKKKFKSIKKLLMGYFENDETKTTLTLKHLLNFGHLSFCAPLMPAIRKRNVVQFEKNLKIYDEYGISWKNVTSLNIIINISMELFLNMTKETYEVYKKFLFTLFDANKAHATEPQFLHTFRSIGFSPTIKFFLNLSTNLIAKCVYHYKIELLWNEEKFKLFKRFLFEYFKDNEDQAKEIIHEMLFSDEYSRIDFHHPFVRSIETGNPYEFNRIIELYEKYKMTEDQIKMMFKSSNIFCTMLYIMSNEIYSKFLKLIKNTFGQNKEELLECLNHMVIYNVVADEIKFILLQKFLTDFFDNDENLKLEFLRKILFFKYSGEVYPLLKVLEKNNIDHIKLIYGFYKDYKLSCEEVQNIFKRKTFFISIFNRLTEESYEIVKNFIKEIFQANFEFLKEMIDENCAKYQRLDLLKNMNKFKLFERFVFDIFADDQLKARKCIKRIVFSNDSSIPIIILEKNLNELKFCIDMFSKYSDNSIEIQENFIECEILSAIFTNYMSDEMYEILSKFILKIFSSNLLNFKKFIKSADIFQIIKNEEKFTLFENLIFEYFDNNEILSKALINEILYKNCNGNALEIDQDTPIYQFERTKNIYINYKNSWSEFFDKILKLSRDNFDSLRDFMVEIYTSNDELIKKNFKSYRHEIIGNAENYKSFTKFLIKYFDRNNEKIIKFLEEFLNNEYEDSSHPLLLIFKENDYAKCTTAIQVYSKYSESLKTVLMQTNNFLKILSSLQDNGYDSFLELMNNIFNSDKSELIDCMNNGMEFSKIWKEQQLDKFLNDFFKIQTDLVRICMRKVLFHNYETQNHPFVKALEENDLSGFEKLLNCYIEYKESDEELQEIIMTQNFIICIFNNFTNLNFALFVKFIKKVFGSDFQKILNFLGNFNDLEELNENGRKFLNEFKIINLEE